jgi:hypothetical protein
MSDLLAVSGLGASASCGAISYWRLAGTLNYYDLCEAWEKAALPADELPEPPSEQVALRRALQQYEGPSTDIVTLPRGQGYAVVDRTFSENEEDHRPEPVHTTRFKVWIDSAKGVCVSPANVALRKSLSADQQRAQGILTGGDIGSWLVTRINALAAIRLRDTGGVYFVPETHREKWSALGEVLHAISASRIYEIPALQSSRAVSAILDALREQASAELTRIETALESGELGARALQTLARDADERLALLKQYEDLLDVTQEDLRAKIEGVRARVVEAALAAELG